MPKLKPGESQDAFVARCIPIVIGDGTASDDDQAVAICNSIFEQDKAMNTSLLSRIKTRNAIRPPTSEFGYGITTADRYVQRALSECGTGLCKTVFQFPDEQALLKEASQKLVYSNRDMRIEKAETSLEAMKKLLPDGIEIPKHTALINVHTLTTPRVDRDKDVLKTRGAVVDPRMPTLWQHLHHLPVGKMLAIVEHTDEVLKIASVLLDLNELTSDMVKLIEADVLRFSHGFRALEFNERKREDRDDDEFGEPGFEVTKFEIMEESLVSVPSNVDAEMELFSTNKLHSDFFKAHAKHYMDQRPVQITGCSIASESELPKTLQLLTSKYNLTDEEVMELAPDQVITLISAEKNGSAITILDRSKNVGGEFVAINPEKTGTAKVEELHTAGNQRRYAKFSTGVAKNFSVENEYLEAHKLEYEWVSRFIGCEVKELVVTETNCSPVLTGSFLSGCRAVASEWDLHDTRNITSDGKEKPPIHKVIQLNSRLSDTLLTVGMQFWKIDQSKKICVKFCENYRGGIECRTYAKDIEGQEFIRDAWNWAHENNFLKGEAFALTGDFLPKTSETFDDIFLEDVNKEALQKLRKRINEKGKSLANRGMIFQGAPGTGKTLSARILRNDCKTTFIWVSARDFYKIGAINGICSALDMARDLAPSIVCLEDVDNWMSDYTVDVLKSELDGVARSSGVVTILTTNYPERMPDALIDRPGRFHDILEFNLPTKTARGAMLRKWLVDDVADQRKVEGVKAIDTTVEKTEGYSGAHLYELCSYAKTIAEEDGLALDEAVEKALAKIHDQRELINQSQLAGSNYRPSHREAMDCIKGMPDGVKHILGITEENGEISITFDSDVSPPEETEQGKNIKAGILDWDKEDLPITAICDASGETYKRILSINLFTGDYKKACIDEKDKPRVKDGSIVVEEGKMPTPITMLFGAKEFEKAGRSLSKRNLETLIDVKEDIEELRTMDGMGRAQKAICDVCIRKLGTVIDAASSDDEEEKPKPKHDDVTPKKAAAILLSDGGVSLLMKVRQAIDAMSAVRESDEQAKQYRTLVNQ